jgi:hypothetical protein
MRQPFPIVTSIDTRHDDPTPRGCLAWFPSARWMEDEGQVCYLHNREARSLSLERRS